MNLNDVDRKYGALSTQTKSYLQDSTNNFLFIIGFHGDLKEFSDIVEIFCSKGDAPIVLRKRPVILTQSDEVFIHEFTQLVAQTNDELLKMKKKKSYSALRIAALREVFMHYCYGHA